MRTKHAYRQDLLKTVEMGEAGTGRSPAGSAQPVPECPLQRPIWKAGLAPAFFLPTRHGVGGDAALR